MVLKFATAGKAVHILLIIIEKQITYMKSDWSRNKCVIQISAFWDVSLCSQMFTEISEQSIASLFRVPEW
jgi:hypothetical protein